MASAIGRIRGQTAWAGWAAAYLASYLLLEWATFRHDVSPLGITPWNPSTGLSVALLLAKGPQWFPVLAAALLAADLSVRQVAFPWWIELGEIIVTATSYSLAAHVLLRLPGFDRALPSMRSLILLTATMIAAAMVVAAGYAGVLLVGGLLEAPQLGQAMLRHWAGDVIGIMAVTPFLLLVTTWRPPRPTVEIVLQVVAVLAAIAIVLGGGDGLREELTYLLFLPIVWIAVRHGLAGVSAGLFVMQIGLLSALHLQPAGPANVVDLQAVLLILQFAGLAIGVLTSEGESFARRLRLQQAQIAHVARTASMGSLSSSLAHEISQPLTAIGNYTRAAERALQAEPPRLDRAQDAIRQSAAQIERAVEIMRKLRGLFEMGRVDLARQDGWALLAEASALMAAEAAEHGTAVHIAPADARLDVMADRVQIVLVLTNLIRNSLEALEQTPPGERRILLRVGRASRGRILFAVADTGPGFDPDFDLDMHQPGQSSKRHGLGVGLALCRSIVEAHAGVMHIDRRRPGAEVTFTLDQPKDI